MTGNTLRTATLAVVLGLLCGCVGNGGDRASTAASVGDATPGVDTGTLDGAPYRVEIPVDWNGELVVLLHGYEPRGVSRADPWPANEATPLFLARGYAVAESGYASQGWAVADAIADSERLRAHVAERHAPRRSWLVGFSMGGQIALASMERHGAAYDGALSLCGANVPATQVFDDALRSLVAFDYFFPDAGLPGAGLSDPDAPPLNDLPADQIALMQTVGTALASDLAAAATLAQALEVPADGLVGALGLHALLLREMTARAGGLPVDNRETIYSGFGDDAAFNAGVRRYSADAEAVTYLAGVADLRGTIGKPLVLRYNQEDPTIPPRYHGVYPALAAEAGRADLVTVMPPAGEGHCAFAPEQMLEAFDLLLRTAG
ncbi:alpha/beta hydrolase family protein [Luteimonas terrae]|uniref:Pimeloyl-ACP methyl ester carboxylesterase n=1 Tax=Luteimonas terrae TaxID=1530191 RepID=A0ABU1XUS2_9GAMM|nr:hypothetical protein [Luteimonas terrae]MDR7191975.1 pimeloyl-ACP methyl ester carboxylesterase [Luteimonas terrae]